MFFSHFIIRIRGFFLFFYVTTPLYCYGELYFDDSMVHKESAVAGFVDLSSFIKNDHQPEGIYEVDVYVNNTLYGKNKLNFSRGESKQLRVIFDENMLISLGVKEQYIASEKKENGYIEQYITDASDKLNMSMHRVDISIPQAALKEKIKDPLYKQRWDDGVNSSFVNYRFNRSTVRADQKSNNTYLGLENGINFLNWRLRNNLYYQDNSQNSGEWSSQNLYAITSIKKIDAIFRIGDDATSNDIFDSTIFKGASLYSDTSMLPESQQGYAPIVRGIARSNALVTIRQSGSVIYETNVSPGPFEISNLDNAISGKELDVTVTESSGEVRSFQQGFTTLPIMLREGKMQYGIDIGEHSNRDYAERKFSQGSISYGLPHEWTLYGGAIYAAQYTGIAAGVGKNLNALGALSLDTQKTSNRFKDDNTYSGYAYRIRYSKMFDTTSTAINLSLNRYDYGFYRLADNIPSPNANKRRSAMQFSASQPLGYWGSIYISGSQGTLYGSNGSNWDVNGGYAGSYKQIDYSVDFSYNKNISTKSDKQIFFEVRIPITYRSNRAWSSYKLLTDNSGRVTHLLGVNGIALDNRNLSYSLQKGMRNYGSGSSERVAATYLSSFAQFSGEYGQTRGSKQINYNVQGAVVAHPYGVTLSQRLGETSVLVRAPGAADVKLQNYSGLNTDYRGYAIIPYVNIYRENYVSLDPRGLKEGVELDSTTRMVTPTRGALVLADFPTRYGEKVLMKIKYKDSYPVFGAIGSIGDRSSGIVSPEGELYLTGVPPEGKVAVVWGEKDAEKCEISYILPKEKERGVSIYFMDVTCI